MTDLSELIEHVRAATGADRAIDRAIMCSIGGWHRLAHSQHGLASKHPRFVDGNEAYSSFEGRTLHRDVPAITASVDAITALIEAKLPAWQYGSARRRDMNGGASAWVAPNEDANRAHAATEPLARTLAFLLALQSQEPS